MKHLFIVLGFCISHFAFSQSEISIDVVQALDYNDFTYDGTLGIDSDRQDKFGYTGGIQFNFGINVQKDIWFFQTGILYVQKRYIKSNRICTLIDLAPGAPPCPFLTLNRVTFLEIPMSVRKNYVEKPKFSLSVSVGAPILIKIDEHIRGGTSAGSKAYIFIGNNRKAYPGLMFSTGLELKTSDRTSLKVIPTIKYHKTDFVDRLLTYEFSASFSYRISKKEAKK